MERAHAITHRPYLVPTLWRSVIRIASSSVPGPISGYALHFTRVASICVRRHRIVRVALGRIQKKLFVSAINLNLTTTSSYEHKMAETGSRVLMPSERGLRSPPADREAPPAHLALEAFLPFLHFLHEFLLFLGGRRLRRIFRFSLLYIVSRPQCAIDQRTAMDDQQRAGSREDSRHLFALH